MDGGYGSRLGPYYIQPRKRNAFEVLNGLAPVAPAVEQVAYEAITATKSLKRLEWARQEFLRVVNSAPGRVVLRPFLPARILETDLTEVFKAAIELRDVDSREAVGPAFGRVRETVAVVVTAVGAQPTVYARRMVVAAVENIEDACRSQLEKSSPPARLEFGVGQRPLPLLEVGVTAGFELRVVNRGDAPAADVELFLRPAGSGIAIANDRIRIGRVAPKAREDVTATLVVIEACTDATVTVEARWTNADHTVGGSSESVELVAHEVDIDWVALEATEPYAPYPVERPEELVGREKQLDRLEAQFRSRPLANLYLTGQRRVGKTSLVRVLTQELQGEPTLVIATVEIGEARAGEGLTTIGTLGRKLAERVIRASGLQADVTPPPFTDSLAPLTDVLEAIMEWDDSLSFLFVIDEFDELPHETYRRDGPGDALFVPMRSLAQKPNVGWLLVGGEKMPFIRDEQAARLNTFQELSLDHLALGSSGQGRGFGALVGRPLPQGFSVDEAAVRSVFEESAGNPHFAKEICAVLFGQAVSRRDAVVADVEVQEAVDAAARILDVELFAHYWEDGIFEQDEQRRRQELQRRAFLTSCAEVLRATESLPDVRVRQAAESRGIDPGDFARLRTEFLRRRILREVEGSSQPTLDVAVPFFRRWLEAEGIYRLPPKGIAEVDREQVAATDERLAIMSAEVRTLTKRWSKFKYRGESISREAVESWIDQFETPFDKRIAFRLLERLKPISDGQIFDGFRRLQRLVARETEVTLEKGQKSLTHIYVSALGGSGASGSSFAYTYRQANSISGTNMIEAGNLVGRLMSRPNVSTVVLVDDFIGSGGTAIKALKPLAARVGELAARPPVQWFLFAVAGLETGVEAMSESDEARRLGLTVELAHPISQADLPFSSASTVFPEFEEREAAKRVLQKYAKRTGARWPLGFGGDATPIVFPENCPNNGPSVLWSDTGDWHPLFLRTGR